MNTDNKIVVIGGGTGTYPVLAGLKKYFSQITAIVTMMDSGGSSGRLRDEFGQLPAGDVRQALVALSSESSQLRELFNYRYSKGEGLEGHSFGNLFLTALAETTGGMNKAVAEAGQILNIQGKVLPITNDSADLMAEFENGDIVRGEGNIDEPEKYNGSRIKKVYLEPQITANPESLAAIKEADLIVLGPGDLYTSLVPNLLVGGVKQALNEASAKIVFVVNLMTKHGQTDNFKASNFVSEIASYLGRNPDVLLVNTQGFPEDILSRYSQEKEIPVEDDLKNDTYQIVRADLLATEPIQQKSGDMLKRSLLRHDSEKLAAAIKNILN